MFWLDQVSGVLVPVVPVVPVSLVVRGVTSFPPLHRLKLCVAGPEVPEEKGSWELMQQLHTNPMPPSQTLGSPTFRIPIFSGLLGVVTASAHWGWVETPKLLLEAL